MIQFGGLDIVVERHLETDEIRRGLATILTIGPERIAVIDDVASYPNHAAAEVVCVVTPTTGEFRNVVSIQCKPMALPFLSTLDMVQELSSVFGTKILVPDAGHDPYLMWLTEPNVMPRQVWLDEAAYDEDQYRIKRILGA